MHAYTRMHTQILIGNVAILGWHVFFLEFGISCKAIIEDGIMYDQIVKGTIIKIGVYAF